MKPEQMEMLMSISNFSGAAPNQFIDNSPEISTSTPLDKVKAYSSLLCFSNFESGLPVRQFNRPPNWAEKTRKAKKVNCRFNELIATITCIIKHLLNHLETRMHRKRSVEQLNTIRMAIPVLRYLKSGDERKVWSECEFKI